MHIVMITLSDTLTATVKKGESQKLEVKPTKNKTFYSKHLSRKDLNTVSQHDVMSPSHT